MCICAIWSDSNSSVYLTPLRASLVMKIVWFVVSPDLLKGLLVRQSASDYDTLLAVVR